MDEVRLTGLRKVELTRTENVRNCNMPKVKQLKSLQDYCLDSITDTVSKLCNYDDVLGVSGPFIDLLRELAALLTWLTFLIPCSFYL